MSLMNEAPECSHCGKRMSKSAPPDSPFGGCSTWSGDFIYICFNDECPYFIEGWDWMWNNYHHKTSYRHMMDPTTGQTKPIPVKTKNTLRECILEE